MRSLGHNKDLSKGSQAEHFAITVSLFLPVLSSVSSHCFPASFSLLGAEDVNCLCFLDITGKPSLHLADGRN